MGKTMLRFKDMNDRHMAITLLEKAHSLFRRRKARSVCYALQDARDQLRTDNVHYNRRLIRVYNALTQRIMGSLNGDAYVTSWLARTCADYGRWLATKPYGFSLFESSRIRRYRQDWIADMIRTLRSGGFI